MTVFNRPGVAAGVGSHAPVVEQRSGPSATSSEPAPAIVAREPALAAARLVTSPQSGGASGVARGIAPPGAPIADIPARAYESALSRGLMPRQAFAAGLAAAEAAIAGGGARPRKDAVLALEAEALALAARVLPSLGDEALLDDFVDRLAAAVQASGVDSADDAALHRIVGAVERETWSKTGSRRFGFFASLYRGQGLGTSGRDFIFSSNYALQRTRDLGWSLAESSNAIPEELRRLGANHIGAIDVADGVVFAPIEDGGKYRHPHIVLYDAETLAERGSFALSRERQPDGVPWVAFDPERRLVCSSVFGEARSLLFYDLDKGMAPAGELALSSPMRRVQGAKVHGGMLYASSDDDAKTIHKVNLRTGTVLEALRLGKKDSEIEGLTLRAGEHGLELHVLSIEPKGKSLAEQLRARVVLHSFVQSAPSLRERVRAGGGAPE